MVFTEILDNFIKILEKVPGNLKSMSMTLLYFLSTIDIALTVFKNINNTDFNYVNWAKMKILNIGFIIFAIKSYEWILNMVKDFFLSIGTKGLGLSLSTNNYFNDPSAIWDKGREIGGLIIDQLSWRPATYIFILLGLLTYIGFFILAMRIIICWVEYYFLTGISIIFLPFGALNLGLEYYKNVFKTIMSCSIKLCVFNMWLLICDKLMKSIMVTGKKYDLDASLVVCGTVYVLVAIMLSMPSITTGLLTGSPAINAGEAMADTYRGTKEALEGAWKGMKTGGKAGATGGAFIGSLGGPVGTVAGKVVGGAFGAVGGAVLGGSYAGARYAAFKEKGKKKSDDESNNFRNSTSSNSSSDNSNVGNTSQGGSASSNGGSLGGTPNQQSTTSNSSGNNGGTPSGSGQAPSSNIQGTTGSINTNAQTQVNTPSSTGDTTNTQPVASTNTTTIHSSNADSTQTSRATQSSANDISTDTNSVNNISTATNTSNIKNNGDSSNNTNSIVDTSSENATTTDTGDSSGKRGVKVNGGEAGKLPDWMDGDY